VRMQHSSSSSSSSSSSTASVQSSVSNSFIKRVSQRMHNHDQHECMWHMCTVIAVASFVVVCLCLQQYWQRSNIKWHVTALPSEPLVGSPKGRCSSCHIQLLNAAGVPLAACRCL
jgi:hypothetical protein